MKKLALLSVSDKTNIVDLAECLIQHGYGIVATGKTASLLSENKIDVTEISSVTSFPEIFDGRVKTLHPKVFGGILYRRDNKNDVAQLDELGIKDIDIVCVNLYPFVKTVENINSSFEDIIENIDIGGPSLIRAAAKNYKHVSILTDPSQYPSFMNELKQGGTCLSSREKLAASAFAHTSFYDSYIADYLENKFEISSEYLRINHKKDYSLRYGENPHQQASVYGKFNSFFQVLHGKELSYNNILDLCAAVELVEDLEDYSCAIIKHNNPAGAASGKDNLDSYIKALKCDPVSAFGGIVAFNMSVDEKTALKLNEIFLEVISAPSYTDEALTVLKKKKDRRIIKQNKEILKKRTFFREIPGWGYCTR